MSNAITFRMNASIPGDVTRFDTYGCTITSEKINATAAATGLALATPTWVFGAVVVVDTNGARPLVAGDNTYAPMAFGFLVRPFPSTDLGVGFPAATVGFGGGNAPAAGVCSVLRRGFIGARLRGVAAPVKGGAVYYFYAASSGSSVQGGVEAANTGSVTLMTNAYWQGAADASGNSELAFNL